MADQKTTAQDATLPTLLPAPVSKKDENASSGHALGQIVGDWFQDHFAQPLLYEVAEKLGLYLDYRLRSRPSRSQKIIWQDEDGNGVDYDFVMELNGTDTAQGIPVAFLECFWRRGSRHSKDKARDDSGKLMPMRVTYPTARFLGIVASGDFTGPARTLVQSREIDLFLVTKAKMIEAFNAFGVVIDYPDDTPEPRKAELVDAAKKALETEGIKQQIAAKLRELIGEGVLNGYTSRVLAGLSALPQEIRIYGQQQSKPAIFEHVDEAAEFLAQVEPQFDFSDTKLSFTYEITYSDGFEFSRQLNSIEELRDLNNQIKVLSDHVTSLNQ